MAGNGILRTYMDKELKDSFSISSLNSPTFDRLSMCRADYHRIFLIKEGTGAFQVDDSKHRISGSELFLLAKGQLYGFHPGSCVTGYELCFGDCFWEKAPASANNCKAVLFNNAAANQQLPLVDAGYSQVEMLFDTLYQEFVKESYANKLDVLAAYLKIIMIKIANVNASLSKGYDNYERQLYRRFVELVSGLYKSTHEVADFALRLDISARKLSDLCKRCGGKGAKDIINGQVIAEAKRSLQFSSKPVKEIAFDLNFSTPAQFSLFFKKHTQLSPNDYRDRFVKIGM